MTKGLPIFITDERLAGVESYNNVIKQIICNSFIKINFIASIFFALLIIFNTITVANNVHYITYNLFAALLTALSKLGFPDCFMISKRKVEF